MADILSLLTKSHPSRQLGKGEALVEAGDATGELYVLVSGRLSVIRDGVEIAQITEPGALIGEMGVLLGIDASATVRAVAPTEVKVIEDAIRFLEVTPSVALHVATLACARLNATSATLAQMRKEAAGKPEQGFIERLFGAVNRA